MKIKSFEVHGLFGQTDPIHLDFNEDLNILSGRNGAGKTTILKLMWYIISGNFEKAAAEVRFNSAKIVTDQYEFMLEVDFKNKEKPISPKLIFKTSDPIHVDDEFHTQIKEGNGYEEYILSKYIGSSFFLPTFRMVEGGFTTEKYDFEHEVLKEYVLGLNNGQSKFNELEDDYRKLSDKLTKKEHRFITTISSKAVNNLLVGKYAEIMSTNNQNQLVQLELLTKQIEILSNKSITDEQYNVIETQLRELKIEQKHLQEPLNNFKSSLMHFFPHYEVEIGTTINFIKKDMNSKGVNEDNLKKRIGANSLSAGEKQILSLIGYNAFFRDTIFFIDEPETSLHADWQRILFKILLKQNPTNQFIISTHSPFIYSKYPEKEVCMNSDRGDSEQVENSL